MITRDNFESSEVVFTGYGRVSTTKEEQMVSHKFQLEDLEDFFASKTNWVDSGLRYDDNGKSGTNIFHRKDFQRMMLDAKAGRFNLIVMRDVSRFARYTKEFLIYLEELEKYGVVVYFVNYGLLSNDVQARMILPMLAAVAEEESRMKSDFTKAGHKKRKELGFVFGSNNRYGWDLIKTDKGKSNLLVINEEEAKVVRLIFDLYINGRVIDGRQVNFGIRKIVSYLNESHIKTKSGGVWYSSTIEGILNNKCFCGYVASNKSFKKNLHDERRRNRNKEEFIYMKSEYVEPIIDESTFYKAQAKALRSLKITSKPVLDENNQPKRDENGRIIRHSVGYKPISEAYAQKLICSCGSTFKSHSIRRVTQTGVKPIGYVCYRYDRGEGTCKNKAIDKVILDMTALKIFNDFLETNKKAIELAYEMIIDCYKAEKVKEEKVNPDTIQRKIDALGSKREKLFNDYTEEKMTDDLYYERDANLHSKIKELTEQLKLAQVEYESEEEVDLPTEKIKIKEALNAVQLVSISQYGYKEVDRSVIENFVSKIVSYEDRNFDWYINLRGICRNDYNQYKNKFSPDYKNRYEVNENAVFINEFTIDIEEANAFVKSYGRRGFKRAKKDGTPIWKDIYVKVFVEF